MQLNQDDVACRERIRGLPDGSRGVLAPLFIEDRDSPDPCRGSDAGDPDPVPVAAELTDHRRAVIAPGKTGRLDAADDTPLYLAKVFVGEAPSALDVDDVHSSTFPAGHRPGEAGIDAGGGGIEVALTTGEVRGHERSLLTSRSHIVDALLLWKLGRRQDICGIDGFARKERLSERLEVAFRVDAVEHGQVGNGQPGRRWFGRRQPQPLLAQAE
jgi:hypothetical protein